MNGVDFSVSGLSTIPLSLIFLPRRPDPLCRLRWLSRGRLGHVEVCSAIDTVWAWESDLVSEDKPGWDSDLYGLVGFDNQNLGLTAPAWFWMAMLNECVDLLPSFSHFLHYPKAIHKQPFLASQHSQKRHSSIVKLLYPNNIKTLSNSLFLGQGSCRIANHSDTRGNILCHHRPSPKRWPFECNW